MITIAQMNYLTKEDAVKLTLPSFYSLLDKDTSSFMTQSFASIILSVIVLISERGITYFIAT